MWAEKKKIHKTLMRHSVLQLLECNSYLHSISHDKSIVPANRNIDFECRFRTEHRIPKYRHINTLGRNAFDHKNVSVVKLCFTLQLNRIGTNDSNVYLRRKNRQTKRNVATRHLFPTVVFVCSKCKCGCVFYGWEMRIVQCSVAQCINRNWLLFKLPFSTIHNVLPFQLSDFLLLFDATVQVLLLQFSFWVYITHTFSTTFATVHGQFEHLNALHFLVFIGHKSVKWLLSVKMCKMVIVSYSPIESNHFIASIHI